MRFTIYTLPEIAYIPGVTARPTTDPLASENVIPRSLSEVAPFENPFFLYGVDLFNHHFFWEAHEAWEEIWHLEESEELRNLLQGLIQLTAGFLKVVQNSESGSRTLWNKCKRRLTQELLDETGVQLDSILKFIEEDDLVSSLSLEKVFHPITLKGVTPLL